MSTRTLPDVTFRACLASDIKAKFTAYETLFGVRPALFVGGTVRDTRGESAFLNTREGLVTEIGTKRVRVDIGEEGDFEMDVTANTTTARYTLRDPQ